MIVLTEYELRDVRNALYELMPDTVVCDECDTVVDVSFRGGSWDLFALVERIGAIYDTARAREIRAALDAEVSK